MAGILSNTHSRGLVDELRDPDYRRAFVESNIRNGIAFQLRAMREGRDFSQELVAEKLGNKDLQPMVSRYENPDYGRYSLSTLLNLAHAFDVALVVRFESFSELIRWDHESSARTLNVPSFQRELEAGAIEAAIAEGHMAGTGPVLLPAKQMSVDPNLFYRPDPEELPIIPVRVVQPTYVAPITTESTHGGYYAVQ